jgi:hypothetical protein
LQSLVHFQVCATVPVPVRRKKKSNVSFQTSDTALHCFTTLFFGLVFAGAAIATDKSGIFGLHDNVISTIAILVLSLFALISLYWAGLSFIYAISQLRVLLDERYPLTKDERLYDDLSKQDL